MDLNGKKVIVIGAGASGLAASDLLLSLGARVILNDKRADIGDAAAIHGRGAELALGHHDASIFDGVELVVVSPGVPPLPIFAELEARGVEVIGELELAYRFCRARTIAITGTNGKSTVTTLLGEMMRRTGAPTFVGGNLGTPLAAAVSGPAAQGGVLVLEVSSFQLERVRDFAPDVGVLLNVTPDHLDRYPSLDAYAQAKANVFTRGKAAVVPAEDALCIGLARGRGADVHLYGGTNGEVRVINEDIVDEQTSFHFPIRALKLAGRHNEDNACASVLAARLAGADAEAIAAALRETAGLPHRAVVVRELDGVIYVDDSKATNVGAAIAALDGLASPERKAVLIAGGIDKGGSYAPLAERLEKVGRAVVLIGEATPLIERAFASLALPKVRARAMEDAVHTARSLAMPGDVVLLAPACSSFDMFKSYAHRGDVFAAAVRALEGEAR
jgi:UDP-N-acetylmuramoylalanine--D-glutamate ligase